VHHFDELKMKQIYKLINILELPELNDDGVDFFLDVWQSFPCLWDTRSPDYKNKSVPSSALERFADNFLHHWTPSKLDLSFAPFSSSSSFFLLRGIICWVGM
jgi:hypothetical protein